MTYTHRGRETREALKRPHEDESRGPPSNHTLDGGGRPPKRQRTDGEERLTRLITKVGDREDQVIPHLTGLTDALPKDIPQHYTHIMNQIMKSIFTLPHKIGVYSTLSGLLTARCAMHFSASPEGAKGRDLGKRVLKLTMEMLDTNLVGGVWWKTMVLIKFASDLVHARVMHIQNMWNILREVVDEVLSVHNSPNRRNGYCYMALAALEIVGGEMHHFDTDLRRRGQTCVSDGPGGVVDPNEPRLHRPVDFGVLYDDISYYMRNRPKHDRDPDTRVVQCWNDIERLHAEGWEGCRQLLATRPYMVPSIQSALPTPTPYPVCTLKRMRRRGFQSAQRLLEQVAERSPEEDRQELQTYVGRIIECHKRGDVEDAYRVWNEIRQRHLQPTPEAYQSMLHVCAVRGDIRKAQGFFDGMVAGGIPATLESYNTLMQVHARAGDEQLFELFSTLKQSTELTPDITTFNIVCTGCARMCRREVAFGLLDEMPQFNVTPDQEFFATLVRNCKATADPIHAATLFLRFTTEYGLPPSRAVYDALEEVFAEAADQTLRQRDRPRITGEAAAASSSSSSSSVPPTTAVVKPEQPVDQDRSATVVE